MILYHENGRIGIFDDKGNEANRYDEIPSFRLKKVTDVRKMVKNDIYSHTPLVFIQLKI